MTPTTPNHDTLDELGQLTGSGYFRVDADRNVVEVSQSLLDVTGMSRDEVLGRPCIGLIRCTECLKGCEVFRRGRVDNARVSLYRQDGSSIEVVRSGMVVRDEEGRPAGALETLALADATPGSCMVPSELEAMLNSLGREFVAADAELRIRAFSSSLPALIGWTEDRLMDATLADLFGQELFGPLGSLRSVLAGKRKEGWQAWLPAPGGGRLGASISVGPIRKEDGCSRPDVRVVVMIRPDRSEEREVGSTHYHGIVGRSSPMQKIFRLIDLLRDNDATVLITGESGTGKELLARAVHGTSHRSAGPFVAVNCAAIPAELLESELFGHVRGAFTGAVRDRVGRFEMAQGGTLFLDEIGELAPALQAKLLRALQHRTFERVGDTETRTVDTRVIAATNADLPTAVAEHRFREDLYYRLRVIPIDVPPLRERREDLPGLIEELLGRMGRRHGRSLRLAGTASRALLTYDWPGNVRELENALEYAVTVCSGQTIHAGDLPPDIRATSRGTEDAEPAPARGPAESPAPGPTDEHPEVAQIREALARAHYRRGRAAEILGMSRTTLWRKMKEHGL
ncbi:MAG: sigma 54-interacting transcriptional regulator [Gemmatimonadota bacterium]|jgi:transcriptional regulator with PAS, ATPase and Fis domain